LIDTEALITYNISMQAKIKGNQIVLAKRYFLEHFDPEAVKSVYQNLSSDAREIIDRAILSGTWEPEEAYVEFLIKADKILGAGDYKLDWECGKFIAIKGIPTVYKIFIKLGDPMFVIERADRFWHQVHSTGKLQIVKTGKNSIIGKVIEKEFPHKAFCATLAGYFYGTLELCGAKNIQIKETICAADRGNTCEFAVSWE
jgi:predicted hydrocarbon binding protein